MGKVFRKYVPVELFEIGLEMIRRECKEIFSIDHMGREWFKVEFTDEVEIEYVLENRPWFVQGLIFALKRWTLEFSPFYATVDSIVCWVRIPFLPLQFRDEAVLHYW